MPEHETPPAANPAAVKQLGQWFTVHHILEEFRSELDGQIAQHGGALFVNDLPDDRDELVQLGARVVHAIRQLDKDRSAAGG